MDELFIRVRAVPGRTVFFVDDRGTVAFPVRYVGADPDGDQVPALRTADGRLIAKSAHIRASLQCGDLVQIEEDSSV